MPTAAEQLAGHAVYSLTAAVMELWEAYNDPDTNRFIRGDLRSIAADWESIGALLRLAAQGEAA